VGNCNYRLCSERKERQVKNKGYVAVIEELNLNIRWADRCWGTVSRPCPRPRPKVSWLRRETFGQPKGHGQETVPQPLETVPQPLMLNAAPRADGEVASGEGPPARTQDARVSCDIVDGLAQLVAGEPADPLAARCFLRAADLDEEVSARFEELTGLVEGAVEAGEAVRAAIERRPWLEVADAPGQFREFRMRHVRGIAKDEVEGLPRRQGTEQVAFKERDAVGNAVSGGVAGR